MSSNDDQQHTGLNTEMPTGTGQSNNANHLQDGDGQKNTTKNKPRSRKSKMPLKDLVPIIAAIITAIATLAAAYLNNQNNRIQLQLSEREKEIVSLKSGIDQRDALITNLQTRLSDNDETITILEGQIDNLKHPLQGVLSQQGKVQFEWQWSGENWYGRVTLQNQGDSHAVTQAKVGLLEKNIEDRFLMTGQVLNLLPNSGGTFEINDGGIHIEIPVMKKDRRSGEILLTTLIGTLQQRLCYAGRILYRDSGGQYQGDMTLVDYAPIFASQLDDWFINERPWFDEYYVDRDR